MYRFIEMSYICFTKAQSSKTLPMVGISDYR